MPRKRTPFKTVDGWPAAPVTTWANTPGIGVDVQTLKRRMAGIGEEWGGPDSFIPLTVILRALGSAKREAEAAAIEERTAAARMKREREQVKLGELIPTDEVKAFFDERCQQMRGRLDHMAIELAGRLQDPDAEKIISDYINKKLLAVLANDEVSRRAQPIKETNHE